MLLRIFTFVKSLSKTRLSHSKLASSLSFHCRTLHSVTTDIEQLDIDIMSALEDGDKPVAILYRQGLKEALVVCKRGRRKVCAILKWGRGKSKDSTSGFSKPRCLICAKTFTVSRVSHKIIEHGFDDAYVKSIARAKRRDEAPKLPMLCRSVEEFE